MVSRYIKARFSLFALSLDLRCSGKHERSLWTDFSYSLVAIARTSLSFQVDRDDCLNQSFGLNLSKGLLKRCTVGSKRGHWIVFVLSSEKV